MARKTMSQSNWLQVGAIRAARVHFLYIAAYVLAIVIFDSWNLITHEAVSQRWTAAGLMLVVTTVLWYTSRLNFKSSKVYHFLILGLVGADIIFASFNVYWQRGMASKAVALFAVPIITAAITRSRSAVIGTATLCAAAYSTAAVRYFNQHYGEGFRVELYGEIFFYSALFFVLIWLLLVIIRPSQDV